MGPLSIELFVPKGVETTVERTIGVSNSAIRPIHVTLAPTGNIASWVKLEPQEFDLPAGPGPDSHEANPYVRVKLTFTIPRDVEEGVYKGDVIANEAPTGGGVLSAGVALSTAATITVGKIGMPAFPFYVNALIAILIFMLFLQLFIIPIWRRKI
jgi:hypothetical protein